MLDVTRLRVLVAVARNGSVTAAARALNYAQPSVSHHIARLEAETGAQLLERVGRGIRLTDAGRLLAERAEEIIGRLDAAEAELAAHVGLREGRVRLAAFPSALGTLVPAAAARLAAETPGMEFMLTEAEPPEALRMLRAGYVDVAVVFQHYQPDLDPAPPEPADEGTRGLLLLDEPVHLVASRTSKPTAGPGRLRRQPLDCRLRALPQLPGPAVRVGRIHAEDLLHHRRLSGGAGARGGRPRRHYAAGPVPAGRPASGHRDPAARSAAARLRHDLRRAARLQIDGAADRHAQAGGGDARPRAWQPAPGRPVRVS